MKTVRDLLQGKPAAVWSVSPDATVFEALAVLAEKGIGAVVVVEGGKLVGILSERDYARQVVLKGKASNDDAGNVRRARSDDRRVHGAHDR